jgi:hypothetical protein
MVRQPTADGGDKILVLIKAHQPPGSTDHPKRACRDKSRRPCTQLHYCFRLMCVDGIDNPMQKPGICFPAPQMRQGFIRKGQTREQRGAVCLWAAIEAF